MVRPSTAVGNRWQNELALTAAGSLLLTVGNGTCYVMPAYLAAAADQMKLGASAIGLLSGTEIVGMALGCAAVGLAAKRLKVWMLAAAAILCVVSDLAAGSLHGLDALLPVRFLTGVFGEGPCFASGLILLGMTRSPERAIGIAITTVVAVTSASFAIEDTLTALAGWSGILLPLAACSALFLAIVRLLPALNSAQVRFDAATRVKRRQIRFTLAGIALWFAAPGMFWTFADTSALAQGLTRSSVDHALSVGSALGLIGSFIPIILGIRIGRIVPIAIATVGLSLSAFLYQHISSEIQATIWIALVSSFWNLAAVYQVAIVASLDRTGASSGFAAVSELGGQGVGALLGGSLVQTFGYHATSFAITTLSGSGLALMAAFLFTRTTLMMRDVKQSETFP